MEPSSQIPPSQPTDTAQVTYQDAMRGASANPQALEDLYQSAYAAGAVERFSADLLAVRAMASPNLLYDAWYYRLQRVASPTQPARQQFNWRLAVGVSVALGLILWGLSAPRLTIDSYLPLLALLWAPITAVALIAYLTLTARTGYLRAALAIGALALLAAYTILLPILRPFATDHTYLDLMLAHTPLLAWAAVGAVALGWRASVGRRFAVLAKSLEVMAVAGVALIVGGVFAGLTFGIFSALGVQPPDVLLRLLIIGGGGLIPTLALASVYDPTLPPDRQDAQHGVGRILSLLFRALLPLTALVLLVYIALIPFNFGQPFHNRNALIIYNVALFAVMGLLLGATPLAAADAPKRLAVWLRVGIILVASLALLVSLYALAAILYRTAYDHLTMNRLTVIGWNIVNIMLLIVLLVAQFRARRAGDWVGALQNMFRVAIAAYILWALVLALALPWLPL